MNVYYILQRIIYNSAYHCVKNIEIVNNIKPKDIGKNIFQPKRINWS